MQWKLIFGILFLASVVMTFIYAEKPLIIYNKTSVENISDSTPGGTIEESVTRTYQDNYASIGGAIGFGVIAAGALIGLALTIRREGSVSPITTQR